MKNIKIKSIIKVLFIFIGLLLVQFAVSLAAGIIYGIVLAVRKISLENPQELLQDNQIVLTLYISIASAIIGCIWCSVLYIRFGNRQKGMDYKNVFSRKNILGIVACGAAGSVFFTMILTLVANLLPGSMAGYTEHMETLGIGVTWISLIYTVFVGPVAEEITFRGAIFDRFNMAFPFWSANILQALVFGIYHFNLIQGIYAFIAGIVFGLVIHVTGSIFASIGTHMLFNAVSYVIQLLFSAHEKVSSLVIILILIVSGVIYMCGIYYFVRKCKPKERFVLEEARVL